MSRPVQYNNHVKFEGIPEGYMGEGFMIWPGLGLSV